MADYLANGNDLTAIANAIRAKGGTSASLEFPSDFIDAVGDIVSVSDVPQRSSSDLSASGATVTAPSGYYPSSASKAVSSGSVTYPDAISSSGATGSHSGTNVVVSKTVTVTPSVTAGYITSVSGTNVSITMQASDNNFVAGNIKKDVSIFGLTGSYEGGGSASIDTKSVTNSDNTATSISFTSMKGTPKAFFLRATSQISSSGSTTYYYITAVRYNGTNTYGNCFRIGSTRRIQNVTSGLSYSYSGTTLTLTSSGSRTVAPGSFYNGDYELVYIY